MKAKRLEGRGLGGARPEGGQACDEECKSLDHESNFAGAAGSRPARSAPAGLLMNGSSESGQTGKLAAEELSARPSSLTRACGAWRDADQPLERPGGWRPRAPMVIAATVVIVGCLAAFLAATSCNRARSA